MWTRVCALLYCILTFAVPMVDDILFIERTALIQMLLSQVSL